MTCSYPLKGYRGMGGKLVLSKQASLTGFKMTVPCGSCKKCRIQHSVDWAIRCTNEMQMHESNSFITLTYNPESLPLNANLNKKHLKDFKKRLRDIIAPTKIRTFDCGEYGSNDPKNETHVQTYMTSKLGRPHYHLIIFGYNFPDKEKHSIKKSNQYYMSDQLNKAWGKGDCIIGDANFQTAAYISRYITKKINGQLASAHYERLNEKTGEVSTLQPEYTTMSNRPGIGLDWLKTYINDVFPSDELITLTTEGKSKSFRVPRYYTDYLEKVNPNLHTIVKAERKSKAAIQQKQKQKLDLMAEYNRAVSIETCAQQYLTTMLTRDYEMGKT
nr:MAG: replication initiation protein [Microvirus sp.]